jgi:hypothetical protein
MRRPYAQPQFLPNSAWLPTKLRAPAEVWAHSSAQNYSSVSREVIGSVARFLHTSSHTHESNARP